MRLIRTRKSLATSGCLTGLHSLHWWALRFGGPQNQSGFRELEEGDRQKIMTICTIDVHSRDVVAKLIIAKVESCNAFQWQSQLRHRWDYKLNHCFANICDAQFLYDYEYLGNTPRLVITPLTDRCYITLTQSLHLIMGGAPAGPAGTGKTETTKDLGRALGIMVYVFNCSEQMDYKSCGNIYKGLAQTGAWGCFDEFNRISVEVLSVVSVQVKTVLDAIKFKKKKFEFMGEYIIPDFELICEIMLVAEGFQEARLLARKFITLYTLCRELLSKQDHYDWGLRAIKSVLVVAGSLKRGDRQRPEDQVLMRALRDFNIPKIVTDDTPIFMGLIGDLFPALDVPRKRDFDFEKNLIDAAVSMKLQPEPGFILKVLTLASNERIALTKPMRLLFEIATLRTATPATVSRAGILYINPQDLGWNPFVASWIETTREDESEKAMLTVMFDKYIPALLETSKKYKRITPLTDLQQIQLTCYLLECFLNKTFIPSESPKECSSSSTLQKYRVVRRTRAASRLDTPHFSLLVTTATVMLPKRREMIQKVLEKPLEKKSGRNFGPPGSKFMIYFVDDLNMPEVDTYGTVQPHTLIREFMDYRHWYDRQKLSLKEISNCMFVSCMNPTAGSFTIDPRLQRHFCTFAGILFTTGDAIKEPSELIRLWMHEATRVYSDKLVDSTDNDAFSKLIAEVIKKNCDEYDEAVVFEKPLIYCHFAEGIGDPKYFPIRDWAQIKRLLDESLSGYNDLVATMNLVLFEDAMYHICRWFIRKGWFENIGNIFLMTDAQVADERFLVLINDLLASGEIPDLLADDEVENVINGVRGEVVLCFSPVGTTLRIRARKFPSIVNCTAINWFHEWPAEALRSVSKRFISEVESLQPELVEPVSNFMSHVHQSVNLMSATYFQNERRYNYTTPKTFLEQIGLYGKLLNEKTSNLKMMIKRLENGLEKLASCAADVAVLKVTLAEQEIILKEKNKAAEELIHVVGAESDKVSKEKAFAAEEEKKVKVIEEDVMIKAKICADDLAKAEPALIAAQEALNTLNKNNLTELKAFGSPPEAVVTVTAAVLVLFSKRGKIPRDRSWKACKENTCTNLRSNLMVRVKFPSSTGPAWELWPKPS
ncbi:hypothetical protein MSG28_013172 [Choristoneura fumiferana]|uniref:Uncharacterized protein n=1 Tax=Choristoneura fumiferana TaxID=7141 RepID=A0ACC0KSB1_CHOFU|nr:hypothetical protein MSG28_013172 [Choristoneura fumiferana]